MLEIVIPAPKRAEVQRIEVQEDATQGSHEPAAQPSAEQSSVRQPSA